MPRLQFRLTILTFLNIMQVTTLLFNYYLLISLKFSFKTNIVEFSNLLLLILVEIFLLKSHIEIY